MGIIIQQGTGTARDSTRLDGRRLGQTDISGSRSKNSKRACQVSGGKGYLLQETQDVGALECRPFETPPLRVEDVAGHGTGVGSIGIVSGSVGGVGGDGGICVGGGGSVGHAPSFTCQPAPHAQDRRRAPVICCLACVAHQHVDTGAQALARDKLSAACRVGVLRVSVDGACSFSRRRQDRLSNGCLPDLGNIVLDSWTSASCPLVGDWLGLRRSLEISRQCFIAGTLFLPQRGYRIKPFFGLRPTQ